MIKTSFVLSLEKKPKPIYNQDVLNIAIPPIERVKNFSPEQFEDFILEWIISCADIVYKDVYKIGAAGDMGRDIIGEYEDGRYDYYQCKRYKWIYVNILDIKSRTF